MASTANRQASVRRALALGERLAGGWVLSPPRRLEALAGETPGRRPGSSLEFEEFREYQPGDDLRHVDWSVYGRSDRLVVRLFREDIQPHLELVIDGSRSMASDGVAAVGPGAKSSASLALAAFFATTALAGGFAYQGWWAGERCRPLAAAPTPPSAWRPPAFDHPGEIEGALAELRWRRRGIRLLISDLLFATPPPRLLARLAEGAAMVVVIQVVSRQELDPPPCGFTRLEDLETGEHLDLLIDGEAVATYRRQLEHHLAAWRRACREVGAVLLTIEAESLLANWEQGRSATTLEPLRELYERGLLRARATVEQPR